MEYECHDAPINSPVPSPCIVQIDQEIEQVARHGLLPRELRRVRHGDAGVRAAGAVRHVAGEHRRPLRRAADAAAAHGEDLLPRQPQLRHVRAQRQGGASAGQPQGRLPALDQGHEVEHQHQGRGGLPRLRHREQGHWAGHQALPWPVPPCASGAVQPRLPGRVGAVDGEQGRGQRLQVRAHGEQHLPQLRRPQRRQVPRRRARRHRGRALEVVRGRQPALEDPAILLREPASARRACMHAWLVHVRVEIGISTLTHAYVRIY